ncbi:Lnb N-terminal periplasmic domain-containing protein [Rhodoblastus sp.]|uniref:Lnb N-terminal periplasmic domain-containing protein n=1 Tax=Rhodoblastus sp. TaxID=1962975 RepID=UPI003F9E870E
MRVFRSLPILALALVAMGFGLWGALAIWYRAPFEPPIRLGFSALWAAVTIGALVALFSGRRWKAFGVMAVAVAALLAWWSTILPSNEGEWAPGLDRTVRGAVEGNILTLTDARNFDWRTESDFTPHWETRRYDLSKLVSVDLLANYWMGEAIAHTLASFGFSDGRFLVWSIEMRLRKDQSFSALGGLFKTAELITLAGDERDLIRLRTNVRREDVRIYRMNARPEVAREILLTYVDEANDLAEHPRWYNTATTNCTTVVFHIARAVRPGIPLDWRVLASGYFPDFAYDHGALDQSLPFAELRERSKIADRAIAADGAPSLDFSRAIRVGIPGVAIALESK